MDTVILLTLVELNSKTRVKSITVSIYSIYIYIYRNEFEVVGFPTAMASS